MKRRTDILATAAVSAAAALLPAMASAQNAEKVHELAERDPHGFIMSITAAGVVFIALLVLYIIYKYVGKGFSGELLRKKPAAGPAGKPDSEVALAIAMALDKENDGEVQAAISLALHKYMGSAAHDDESFVITIRPASGAWNSRQLTLRQLPEKKR